MGALDLEVPGCGGAARGKGPSGFWKATPPAPAPLRPPRPQGPPAHLGPAGAHWREPEGGGAVLGGGRGWGGGGWAPAAPGPPSGSRRARAERRREGRGRPVRGRRAAARCLPAPPAPRAGERRAREPVRRPGPGTARPRGRRGGEGPGEPEGPRRGRQGPQSVPPRQPRAQGSLGARPRGPWGLPDSRPAARDPGPPHPARPQSCRDPGPGPPARPARGSRCRPAGLLGFGRFQEGLKRGDESAPPFVLYPPRRRAQSHVPLRRRSQDEAGPGRLFSRPAIPLPAARDPREGCRWL